MNSTEFSALKLHPGLLDNLASLDYQQMTPIQSQSLPFILEGRDVIGQGKTGSGKTAAFGLGILNRLDARCFSVQSLVLCPTRELADQVASEIRMLARMIPNVKVLVLCGGKPLGPQINSLEHGAHIVVGTPGRVGEHLRKGKLVLEELSTFVLDEADRMLDMGFQEAIDEIVGYLPVQRQTLLFSATYPKQIQSIAQRVMSEPELVKVESTHDDATIEQCFYKIESEDERIRGLRLLLLEFRPGSALVFCNTKRETQEVADELTSAGFSALALHGDLEQRQRDQILVRFANKSSTVLVATDVAARGLDIDSLDAVINYSLARETAVHVHRIGRTGRAGSRGLAITLYSEKERFKLDLLEDMLGGPVESRALPPDSLLKTPAYQPPMATLQIDGGKNKKSGLVTF